MIKPSEKSIALIKEIFEQGDSRYDDNHSAYLVALFLDNQGIIIHKEVIQDQFEPSEEELREIRPPQQHYKFIGKKLLEFRGYKLIGYEASLPGGRPDILAKHTYCLKSTNNP